MLKVKCAQRPINWIRYVGHIPFAGHISVFSIIYLFWRIFVFRKITKGQPDDATDDVLRYARIFFGAAWVDQSNTI